MGRRGEREKKEDKEWREKWSNGTEDEGEITREREKDEQQREKKYRGEWEQERDRAERRNERPRRRATDVKTRPSIQSPINSKYQISKMNGTR